MKSGFSETLSRLRHDKNLSQRKVAGELGISQALLSHYENGAREPKLEFVVRACEYYGVSADYILGRITKKTFPAPDSFVFENSAAAELSAAIHRVAKKLEEASDPQLSENVVKYLRISVDTALNLLSDPNFPYNPMRDAEMKTAEASLITNSRGLWSPALPIPIIAPVRCFIFL